jgi:hypothetical protein
MKRLSRWPLVLLTLVFGNPAAVVAADDNMPMPKSGASGSAATASQPTANDTLSLSDSERSIVHEDISQYATKAKAPPGSAPSCRRSWPPIRFRSALPARYLR